MDHLTTSDLGRCKNRAVHSRNSLTARLSFAYDQHEDCSSYVTRVLSCRGSQIYSTVWSRLCWNERSAQSIYELTTNLACHMDRLHERHATAPCVHKRLPRHACNNLVCRPHPTNAYWYANDHTQHATRLLLARLSLQYISRVVNHPQERVQDRQRSTRFD